MTTTTLCPTDQAYWKATHKVVVTYADVAALAGTGAALPLFTAPAKTRVSLALVVLNTAFNASDAAINSLTMEIGDDGDVNRFLTTAVEMAVDGTEILYACPAVQTNEYVYVTSNTVDATVLVAGGSDPTAAEINSGQVSLYFSITDISDPMRA